MNPPTIEYAGTLELNTDELHWLRLCAKVLNYARTQPSVDDTTLLADIHEVLDIVPAEFLTQIERLGE